MTEIAPDSPERKSTVVGDEIGSRLTVDQDRCR